MVDEHFAVPVEAEPTRERFFTDFVLKNEPLVVRNYAKQWKAKNWSKEYFAKFEDEHVRVAPLRATGSKAFLDKWIEPATKWKHIEMNPTVVNQDKLLVVAASRINMPLSRFCHLLAPHLSGVAATFYADGASNLFHSFPFLAHDFEEPNLAQLLDLKRADLWIGEIKKSLAHTRTLPHLPTP